MKLVIICLLSMIFAGCATVSEYNQGCRDGIMYSGSKEVTSGSSESTNQFCNDLDTLRKEKEQQARGHY